MIVAENERLKIIGNHHNCVLSRLGTEREQEKLVNHFSSTRSIFKRPNNFKFLN